MKSNDVDHGYPPQDILLSSQADYLENNLIRNRVDLNNYDVNSNTFNSDNSNRNQIELTLSNRCTI